MYCYRITKYDPKYRNSKGCYMKDEWTSVDDVGRIYSDTEFTLTDYVSVEEKYIHTIKYFMSEMKVDEFIIKGLEKYDYRSFDDGNATEQKKWHKIVKEGMTIKSGDIEWVVQLILRNTLWAKLVNPDLEVHFGYDYYMYICSKVLPKESLTQIMENGLFAESMRSPYL